MADPTLGLSFSDLRIRVAEYLGIAFYGSGGNEAAQLPTDAHDLDLVGRLVNDGYRRFLNERLERWSFMRPLMTIVFREQLTGSVTSSTSTTLVDTAQTETTDDAFNGYSLRTQSSSTGDVQIRTISDYDGTTKTFTVSAPWDTDPVAGDEFKFAHPDCVEGDNHRYAAPDDFMGVLYSPFTYPPNGPIQRMTPVPEHQIRDLIAGSDTQGQPTAFAVESLNTTAVSTGRRWGIVFWPKPNILLPVQARYQRYPQALSGASDRSVAGFQHDETVLKAAIAEAELQRDDKKGPRAEAYERAVLQSVKIDVAASTPKFTNYGDTSDDVIDMRALRYDGVDNVHGIDITRT